MPTIHPTAIVDPGAELADDVIVGPNCVIEPDVKIGPGCRLRESVIVRRYTTMGANNSLDAFTVMGGEPQDLKFDPATISYLRIGDDNVFREGVTISRATGEGNATVVGSHTYWMALAHAGHNAVVQDHAILVNGATVGGHGEVGARAILSAHAGIHQYTWIGEMVMVRGNGGATMHVPPYCIVTDISRVAGLNTVGLQRAEHITAEDRKQIKEAFRLTYRSGLTPAKALEKMDGCTEWGAAAGKFRDFIRRVLTAKPPYNRGLCQLRSRKGHG